MTWSSPARINEFKGAGVSSAFSSSSMNAPHTTTALAAEIQLRRESDGTMAQSEIPFHADHIGSFIRPASLSQAQAQADAGTISSEQLREAQRASISDIVRKQQSHGILPITSGEFDRKYYFGGFFEKLGGFREYEPVPWELARLSAPPVAAMKKSGQQYPMAAVCEGKIRYERSPYLESWLMLRNTLPEEQWARCKFTMPPPCYFHLRLAPGKCYSPEAYGSDDDFFKDVAEAYRQELKTLYEHGLRHLQVDDPTLAYFCSDEMLESLREDGIDPDELFAVYLKAHNDCIACRPSDLHVGLHVCRGSSSPVREPHPACERRG